MNKLPLDVLKDENAPVIALLAVVIYKYGVEAIEWNPEVLREELEQDFNFEMSDLQSDKLQAGICIIMTNLFEEQWEAFLTCVHLLNGIHDTFEDVCPLEPEYIASALADIYFLKEADEIQDDYSDEVKAFVGIAFHNHGMCNSPSIFPNAIMPPCNVEVNKDIEEDKDQSFIDIFEAKKEYISDYMSNLNLIK